MQSAYSSKISVDIYQITWHHIPEYNTLNILRSRGFTYTNCFNILKLGSLLTECIYGFRTVLTISDYYLFMQHLPAEICSRYVMCFL
jgi:hypothetical protein